MRKTNIFAALMLAGMTSLGASAQHQFAVQANKPGVEIQPTMYGIFFEDINFGADGGLYAEMVENRSFEFPQRLMGWNTFGNVTLNDVKPAFDRNPHYVTLESAGAREKQTGLENRGFKMILNGELDEYPEQAFLNVGTIDEAIEKGKKLLAEVGK